MEKGLVPAVVLISMLVAGACGAPSPDDRAAGRDAGAEARIAAWIEAAGGESAWDDVRTLRYTVTTVWYESETGLEQRRRPRFVWIRKLDGGFRVRVEREEPEGRYVQAWDGERAWGTLNGRLLDDSAAAVIEIPHVAGDLTYWIGLPWKLRDPGVRLEARAAGGGDIAVEVSFEDGVGLSPGDRYWYHFRDGEAFPWRVDFLKENLPAESRERTLWSEWRRGGRMTYVGERLYVDAQGRRLRALLLSDVEPGVAVADSLFEAP